jgi:hypothetical protein
MPRLSFKPGLLQVLSFLSVDKNSGRRNRHPASDVVLGIEHKDTSGSYHHVIDIVAYRYGVDYKKEDNVRSPSMATAGALDYPHCDYSRPSLRDYFLRFLTVEDHSE